MRELFIIVALVSASLGAQVTAPSDPLDALVRDSPFLPVAGTARGAASGASGSLEFRSVVFERGEFAFSIYDQASRESKWVRLGQTDLPFVARSYDQEQDLLTVEYQGRITALKLQPARMAGQASSGSGTAPPPLPSAQESAGPAQPRPANSTSTGPPSASPPPAVNPEESQRLQEMADEIRRRRQLPVSTPKI